MTIKFRLFAMAGLAMTAAACATNDANDLTTPPPAIRAADPEFSVRTNMAEGVFEVALANPGDMPVCVADGDWPSPDFLGKEATPSGSLHMASQKVYATVGDQRFPIESENLGYCDPNTMDLQDGHACYTVVSPGATRTAVIPFGRFPGLVQATAGGSPVLTYRPVIKVCE